MSIVNTPALIAAMIAFAVIGCLVSVVVYRPHPVIAGIIGAFTGALYAFVLVGDFTFILAPINTVCTTMFSIVGAVIALIFKKHWWIGFVIGAWLMFAFNALAVIMQ